MCALVWDGGLGVDDMRHNQPMHLTCAFVSKESIMLEWSLAPRNIRHGGRSLGSRLQVMGKFVRQL